MEIIFAVLGVVMAAGGAGAAGAWRGSKAAINGLGLAIGRVEDKLDAVEDQTQDNRVAIEAIRTRCVALHPEAR